MDGRDVRIGDLPDDPGPGLGHAPAVGVEVVGLDDHHVAGVTTPALQEATRRRVGSDRRHDLEEGVSHGHHGVLEAEDPHAGIAVGDFDSEDGAQVGDHGLDLSSGDCDLSNAHGLGPLGDHGTMVWIESGSSTSSSAAWSG
jgi:hypothetical protein